MDQVQAALDNVQNRPELAIAQATVVLDDPEAGDYERAAARWAIGRAHSELDDVTAAIEVLELGLADAETNGLDELSAEIAISLSVCLLTGGDPTAARSLLVRADGGAGTGATRGRLLTQRGLLALHMGNLDDAIADFDGAEPLLVAEPDHRPLLRLFINRGVAFMMAGDHGRGERDNLAARRLADELGQHMVSAGAAQNLGFMAGRRGDVPAALAWFDAARAGYEEVGSPRRVLATLENDQGAVLLNGGLYREAAAAAARAAALASAGGNRLNEAESVLLLARARLAEGDHDEAEAQAATAAAYFRDSERGSWAALADYVGLQAAVARGDDPDDRLYKRAVAIADDLAASGRGREALEIRTFAGRTALALGNRADAGRQLTLAATVRETGSAATRAEAWLAQATLLLADGDRPGAAEALSVGMSIVEEQRASLGSTELRAHASINAAQLASLGLSLAVDDDDGPAVLRWAERWHAGAISVEPVRPDPASPLADAMAALRQAYAEAEGGTIDPFADEGAEADIAALERKVRALSRQTDRRSDSAAAQGTVDAATIAEALGEGTALIEYAAVDGHVIAVTVDGRGAVLHRLGPIGPLADDVAKINAGLGRLAFGRSTPRSRHATARALTAAAGRVDEAIFTPLDVQPDAAVVIVPTGPLQRLAVALLPGLAARTVTVAPSAAMWLADRVERPPSTRVTHTTSGDVVLVCGSNVPGGQGEIDGVRLLYDNATVLAGPDATVAAVTAAMQRAKVVHLAAHGRFRADNPMFSSLDLADGPLTIYDIESLRHAPDTVILSACDAARASVRDGDEVLGTATSLLQVGVRQVIAPVTVVPDTRVVPSLMAGLHHGLRAGLTASEALVAARMALANGVGPTAEAEGEGEGESHDLLTASSFVTIGSRALT